MGKGKLTVFVVEKEDNVTLQGLVDITGELNLLVNCRRRSCQNHALTNLLPKHTKNLVVYIIPRRVVQYSLSEIFSDSCAIKDFPTSILCLVIDAFYN